MRYFSPGVEPSDWTRAAGTPSAGVILQQRRLRGGWYLSEVAGAAPGLRLEDVYRVEQGLDTTSSSIALVTRALGRLEGGRCASF